MEEGVQFSYLKAPVEIVRKNGKLAGLVCIKMKLGEPDDSGRRRPVPVKGSEFVVRLTWRLPQPDNARTQDFLPVRIEFKDHEMGNHRSRTGNI